MQKRTTKPTQISADSLKLEAPVKVAAKPIAVSREANVATPEAVVVVVANPEPVARHNIPHSDIGNWKFTPWKGFPMWTHRTSGLTSFKADFVSRRRNQ